MSLVEPNSMENQFSLSVTTKRLPICIYVIPSMCNFKKWDLPSYKNELAGPKQI